MSSSSQIPDRASVVIIGGGVMGTSTAFHLAEAGHSGVVLIERDQLASGSTSRSAGGFRVQFSDPLNIEISLRSVRALEDFQRRPGAAIDLHRVGYLFLLSTDEQVAAFQRSVEVQHAMGVPTQWLDADQAQRLCPLIETSDVLAATWCPWDGHCAPEAVVGGYAAAARAHGAALCPHTTVTAINTDAGRILSVDTNRGLIETSVVVCCAGAWSGLIGDMAGAPLPVTPLRRQVLVTEPIPDMPDALPLTIDFSTGFYFHREGPGLLAGMPLRDEPAGFNLTRDDTWLEPFMHVAERRAPIFLRVGISSGWAGLYEMSPDHNGIIGEADTPSRFLYATGFSGHGFQQGPAVGEILRDLILGREPFCDITPMRRERFDDAAPRPEFNIV